MVANKKEDVVTYVIKDVLEMKTKEDVVANEVKDVLEITIKEEVVANEMEDVVEKIKAEDVVENKNDEKIIVDNESHHLRKAKKDRKRRKHKLNVSGRM